MATTVAAAPPPTTAQVDEIRLHERLQAAQKQAAECSTRARAAASSAADEAQRTLDRRTVESIDEGEMLNSNDASSGAFG